MKKLLALATLVGMAFASTADSTRYSSPVSYATPIKVIRMSGYTVIYDTLKKCPVSTFYTLTPEQKIINDFATRKDAWHDSVFTASFRESPVWTALGYDRGHLVPAEDMQYSKQSAYDVFSMVNIVPQWASFNRGSWAQLEKYVRTLAAYDTIKVSTSASFDTEGTTGVGTARLPKLLTKLVCSSSWTTCRRWEIPNSREAVGVPFGTWEVPVTLNYNSLLGLKDTL